VAVPAKISVPDPAVRRRWAVVSLLFAASLINYLDRASLSLALPVIGVDLHLDPTGKGLLLSAFFWSYAFMQVPVGICVDRFPIRWVYAGMFALWSLACGFTGFVGSLTTFVVLRVLLGVGEAVYFPGGTKLVYLLFSPKSRGLPSGIFNSGTRLGFALGGLIVPSLIVAFGWRAMFLIVGFGSLVWLLPWLYLVPGGVHWDRREASTTTVRLPAFNRNLLGICLGFFCFDYFLYLLLTWLPDYLVQARHLTMMRAGIYSALPFLAFGVSEIVGGGIADRLMRRGWTETRARKAVVTVGFLSGLLLIPAVFVSSGEIAIALIVGACFVGLSTGNSIAIVQACAPVNEIAAWSGMQNLAGNLGGIVAPLLTGMLISRTGSYVPGFILAAVLVVAGILPYWLILGELRPSDHPRTT
jgi:MFS transporter, ACS family, D-galactonate transporter